MASWRTRNRGRILARYLGSSGGMVHVEVSDPYPVPDDTAASRVMFELHCPKPVGTVRVVARQNLYGQRLWLLGATGGRVRVAVEGLPNSQVDDGLVMMSVRSFAILSSMIMDARPEFVAEAGERAKGE